jgi:alkylation response protein AidB-like acyl-CoA dehydrogenase
VISTRWTPGFGDTTFDLFTLSDEQNQLRAVLRDLCEKEIAPYAADVDEHSRFPEEALEVLNDSGRSALHVPEESRQQRARHDDALNLIGALVDLGDLCVAHHAFDREVDGVAGAAEQLHGVGGDLHQRPAAAQRVRQRLLPTARIESSARATPRPRRDGMAREPTRARIVRSLCHQAMRPRR